MKYWDYFWDLGVNPLTHIRFHLRGKLAEFKIRPGDIYEDCAYHPVLCIENDRGDLSGISLIDGTWPRGCSMFHCGPVKLSVAEAVQIKKNWKPGQDKVDWSAL